MKRLYLFSVIIWFALSIIALGYWVYFVFVEYDSFNVLASCGCCVIFINELHKNIDRLEESE